MTTLNINLLREVLAQIVEHPETWDQKQWAKNTEPRFSCGTTMCVAGHIAVMTGHQLDWKQWGPTNYEASWTTSGDYIATVARKELGIDAFTADRLFLGTNTLEDLISMAKELAEDAGEKLELNKYMKAKKRYNLVSPAKVKAETLIES